MSDLIYLAATLLFFGVMTALVYGFERMGKWT